MKKSDLKNMMRVELRSNEYNPAIIVKTGDDDFTLCTIGNGGYGRYEEYRDDMTEVYGCKELDIMKVFATPDDPRNLVNADDRGVLLWEREEKTIATIDGIEYSESTLRSIIKKATNE